MTKLFFLGATGHIGGATLHALLERFSGLEIVALVRDHEKAASLSDKFKTIRTIVGDFQNLDLISREAASSDVVINTSPDLLPGSHEAIQAILAVMSARSEKGYYIQTSGAFLVAENTGGSAGSGKTWSDIADIDAIVAMPPTSFHQPTEQLVRNAATNVNVAIVSPTVVYGLSRGVEHQAPITIRDIVKTITELGTGFTMSRGANVVGYIHVDDLADIYVRLLAGALQGGQDSELWGPHAYYFAVGEEMSFAAYMKALVEVLQQKGILSTNAIREIGDGTDAASQRTVAKTAAVHGCGLEVRCQSDRARKLLGWKPESSGLIQTLPEVVDSLLQRQTS